MRVLIYGDSRYASGGWCYGRSFSAMGHDVTHFSDPENAGQFRSLPLRAYKRLFRRLPHQLRARHLSELMQTVSQVRPHILIVLKGLHISADDIAELKRSCGWVININHDDFFSYNHSNWSPIQRAAIPAYDYVFVTRRVNVREVMPLNPRVEFFPFAFSPEIHRVVNVGVDDVETFANDVVFIGTWERSRAELLEHLVGNLNVRVGIYGSQWSKLPTRSPLRGLVRGDGVFGDEMCTLIGGAKVALGFLRKENRDEYTQRTFEIPACGGVFLAERTDEHIRIYREGIEADFFDPNDFNEFLSKVRSLLDNPERRESIRAQGKAAVLRGGYTYDDRVNQLLAHYDSF